MGSLGIKDRTCVPRKSAERASAYWETQRSPSLSSVKMKAVIAVCLSHLLPQLKEPLPVKMLCGEEEVPIRPPIMLYFENGFSIFCSDSVHFKVCLLVVNSIHCIRKDCQIMICAIWSPLTYIDKIIFNFTRKPKAMRSSRLNYFP